MNIAIVTGASSGLGREFVVQLDKEVKFDQIWIIARREQRLKELVQKLRTKTVYIKADLTVEKDINIIINKIKKERPNIRILVNSAGYGKSGYFHNSDIDEQLGMVNLNIKALVKLTYECLPFMSKGAKIVQVASMASYFAIPGSAVYSASKAFVLSFSNALNAELKGKGIHSIAVCPGKVATEFFDRSGMEINPKTCYTSKCVVDLAIKDAKKNKWVSIQGAKMKFARIIARLLSKRAATRLISIFKRLS